MKGFFLFKAVVLKNDCIFDVFTCTYEVNIRKWEHINSV